ncbi:MAG: InlB B-repeat-containing protein, partial [Acholeplasmatales bacterium]|nr:InlB B-repeat-containing protein [Acholeplasmatales bacterium]
MKKKNIVLSLFVGVAALSALASCGKKKGDKKDDVTTSTTTSEVSTSSSTSDVTPSSSSTSDVTPLSSSISASTSITSVTLSTTISYNLASGSMESDETVTVEYNPATGLDYEIISEIPTYDGYRFAGWKVSGDDTIYQAEDTYHIDEEHEAPIFVAQWVKQVSVSLYSNKPFGSVETIRVDENGSFVVEAPEERENYTFLGYASSFAATEAAYNVGDTVNIESTPISLYGVWTGDTVELSYYLQNNTYPIQNLVPKTENVQAGKDFTLPNPDLSEYGLTFLGWSKNYYSSATPTNFTVDFKGGEKIPVDELDVADGKATLYGCYVNATAHPFEYLETIDPTIYSNGAKVYKCGIEGHTEKYVEVISNRNILAARV